MIWKSAWVCLAMMAAVISLRGEEPAKEEAAAPLVAADLECWELGTALVSGGWSRYMDGGSVWFFTVSEILEVEEGDRKMRGRFRRVVDLDLATYQRMRRMDDAAFLKAFGKLHGEKPDADYEYWNEVRDGAVFYHDNDTEDDAFHKPDVAIPKDLTPGTKFRSFGDEVEVVAYEKKKAAPGGECEAVRMDHFHEGEEIDGEEYPPSRVETWYGRGLSNLAGRMLEFAEEGDEKGRVMEEWSLQRVIRPVGADGEK